MRHGLPHFEVALAPPDLRPWLAGDDGIPGFVTREAAAPGPRVLLLSLMHGNEFAGAVALDAMLRQGFQPTRGRVTLGFANLDAFAAFDPAQPTQSRFVEEDLNRVWDRAVLEGPANSVERRRARQMLPAVLSADVVLDLHSMLWPSEPLVLAGLFYRVITVPLTHLVNYFDNRFRTGRRKPAPPKSGLDELDEVQPPAPITLGSNT